MPPRIAVSTPIETAGRPGGLGRLDRKLPAADQIYRVIRDAIISGQFRPREAMSENRICGMFAVSRSPVRIALTRLAEDGLIDIFPQRGSFVAPIKLQQVREGHFARVALELAVLREAADHWSKSCADVATEAIRRQKRFARDGDAWRFHTADEQFHRSFAVCAGLEGVWTTIQGVKTHLDRVRHLANPVKGHMDKVIAEHEAIIAQLDDGRPDDAVAAMRHHLDSLHATIERLRPLHKDYFVEE
ncbi:MAG TPA: GntR family transcriptional regulator [Aestuariivirga sp.]|nr:GntR family transcriptional regulator [Alphaproteobacteria bacterium]HRX36931.1 GntR family transcriptional regulator [Aestuariivirga sp.]